MRESQYIDAYLEENAERGPGKGLTPATYLAYTLHGKAAQYSGSYCDALMNAITKRVKAGRAKWGRSCKGSKAAYPV